MRHIKRRSNVASAVTVYVSIVFRKAMIMTVGKRLLYGSICDYKITCTKQALSLVNTRVWIRVSKHGNCRLRKIGKINVHDVNNCFNFATNINQRNLNEIVKNKKRLTGGFYTNYIQRLKRCWQIHPGHTQAKCTYKRAQLLVSQHPACLDQRIQTRKTI